MPRRRGGHDGSGLPHLEPFNPTGPLGALPSRVLERLPGAGRRRLIDELRASRARLVAAATSHRRQFERDLDGAQQQLAVVALKLGVVEKTLEDAGAGTKEVIAEARQEVDQAMDWLRDIARRLYPAVLSNDGLASALAHAAERTPVGASLECEGLRRYSSDLEAVVYFCCVEALETVALRGGEGATASIVLRETDRQLRFQIADEAPGPEVTVTSSLQTMKDAVAALGGELTVESAGEGAIVTGVVPL